MPSKKFLSQLNGDWTAAEIIINYKPAFKIEESITDAWKLYSLVLRLWDKERINVQEQIMALFLDRQRKVLGYKIIATGTQFQCLMDQKLVMSLALHTLAS